MPPSSRAGLGAGMSTGTGAAWGGSGVTRRSNGLVIGLVIGLVLLAGAAAAGVLLYRSHGSATTAAPPTGETSKPQGAPAAAAVGADPVPSPPVATADPTVLPLPAETPSASAGVAAGVAPAAPGKPSGKTAALVGKGSAKAAPAKATVPAPATAPAPAAPKPAKKANLYDDRK
jgi:hypothetical protein